LLSVAIAVVEDINNNGSKSRLNNVDVGDDLVNINTSLENQSNVRDSRSSTSSAERGQREVDGDELVSVRLTVTIQSQTALAATLREEDKCELGSQIVGQSDINACGGSQIEVQASYGLLGAAIGNGGTPIELGTSGTLALSGGIAKVESTGCSLSGNN